jgi:thiamine transport system permease protein
VFPPERVLRLGAAGIALAGVLFLLAGGCAAVLSGNLDIPGILREFASPECRRVVQITLFCTACSVGLSWMLAVPLTALFRERNAALLRAGALLPGMAYALLTLTLLRVCGARDLYSLRSVILAWALAGALYIASGWVALVRDLDPRQKEALRVLGAGPMRAFFLHEFLRTRSGQWELLLQQVWLCFTSFSLVLILNGGPPHETLEVAIYSALRLGNGSMERAVALALWQGILLFGLRWVSRGLLAPGAGGPAPTGEWTGARRGALRRPRRRILRWMLAGTAGAIAGLPELLPPLGTSLLLGGAVALACALFGFSCYFSGFRKWAEIASWTSPMILSFMVWGFWNGRTLPAFNVGVLQALIFAPWFSRSVFPLLDRMRTGELQAARVLGANPVQAWWLVEWPRLRGGVLRCMGLVFSLSLMEVTSVLLFSRGDFETLSGHAQGLLMRFRMEEAALALALLLGIGFSAQFVTEEIA